MSAVLSPTDPRVVDIFTGLDFNVEGGPCDGFDFSNAPVRTLAAGEHLFEQGDAPSHVYRVETGALSLFTVRQDGSCQLLDIAHPGDLVALGALERHACHARAEVAASVRCLTRELVVRAAADDPAAAVRVDAARRAEFEFRRKQACRVVADAPAVRAAAFLLVMSRNNRSEGRDPAIVTDELKCGTVAHYLGMSLDELGGAVCELEARGLVAAADEHALRLTDLEALERFVDAA